MKASAIAAIDESGNSTIHNGPGDQLKAARIEQGLAIEDVAARMHLSLSILQSIEDNNFEGITAPIFVKGYLRAYARLVALDEDKMIQRYVELYANEDPPLTITNPMPPEVSVQHARIQWIAYLVIIVLVALLSAWWWNRSQNKTPVVSLDAESSTVELAIKPIPVEAASSSSTVVDNINPESAVVNPEPSGQSDGASTGLLLTGSSAAVVVQPEAVESDTTAVTDAGDAVAPTKSAEAPDGASGTLREAPVGADLLRIVVHADTWADIKDANNHHLAYDLLRANATVQIKGQAPFSAFFGNGHGVELSFNNESVDIASYTRENNTARLKIGTH